MSKKQERIAIIALVALLVAYGFYQVAYAESEIAPQPGKSDPYNAGFAQGYLGLALKGHHTNEFLLGYINGSSLIQSNRGDVQGYSGLPATSNNPDYIKGYKQGVASRADTSNTNSTLPAHTDDNYMDFFVGYYNAAVDADNHNGDSSGYVCCSGHTQEYCLGYKAGYSYESYLLNDA